MNRGVQFLGIIGLIALLFALVTNMIVYTDDYFLVPLHLLVAGVCLVIFVVRGGVQLIGTATAQRAAGFGAGVTLYSAVFIALLGFVNYEVSRHDVFHYDSTEEKAFTLAPQTVQVLASLKKPVFARAFFVGKIEPEAEALLNRIAKASNKFHWAWLDPDKQPTLMEKFGISQSKTVHFSYEGEAKGPESKVVRDVTEQEVVNALLKLTRSDERNVYIITGHGEADLESSKESGFLFLKESIEGENIKVKKLVLADEGKIPDDAAAVLLLAPRRELLPPERAALEDYLKRGGNAILVSEPKTTKDVAELVRPLGIEVGNDLVVDQVVRMFAGPGLGVQPMVTNYGIHPAVQDFAEGTIFSTTSSVTKAANTPEGAEIVELAMTSPNSWAEKDLERLYGEQPTASRDPDDLRGPVSVAVAFEGAYPKGHFQREGADATAPTGEEPQKKSRIIVLGDVDFLANANIRQLYNADFFLNLLNWTVDPQQGVTIRARNLRRSVKLLTDEQFSTIFVFTGLVFPELLLMTGFGVWWFRRK